MVDPIELQNCLKGVDYPASRQDLIDKASENGASEEVIDALNAIPDNTYDNPTDVQSAIGDGEGSEEA